MNYGKLIIAVFTVGPLGFAMGAGFAWLFGASTPSLFGGGVGALFVVLAMLQSVNGKSIPESDRKKAHLDEIPNQRTLSYDVAERLGFPYSKHESEG
ncbi:hypothetical protein KGA65_19950 [Ideonella sp. B7]|uniref:hypothetical protein n=1 Tax=Ideonella benzenivorans TaxID=2831643 RepID=UPI001CEC0C14|nr:hypothetical protein [Ideonella benzenivorans]MCA6218823.1 hypothetical protein [Ideonella benzenivorans]